MADELAVYAYKRDKLKSPAEGMCTYFNWPNRILVLYVFFQYWRCLPNVVIERLA